MQYFKVEGNKKLKGHITPQGSKNESLPILSASLLTKEAIIIKNVPDILDIKKHLILLKSIGVQIQKLNKSTYQLQSHIIDKDFYKKDEFKKNSTAIRGSITILGPLLHLTKQFSFLKPGGDNIGKRHIDTHITALNKLGAHFDYNEIKKTYHVQANKIKGTYILMEEASITATANLIMAASKAEGITTIYNAACEPYIQQLCYLLNSMGAEIKGIGSNLLTITGVKKLHGTTHEILPDMIEVGSFIAMAITTQSCFTIKNCGIKHLGIMPTIFQKLGASLTFKDDDIIIDGTKNGIISRSIDGSILKIDDAPWPGLSPDMLSIMLVCATTLKGTVLFHQKMFESRLFFVDKLINMGAQIILCDPHRATVIGLENSKSLLPITMSSPDIRAGIALLIAAMSAKGTSIIHNISQIDRGYTNIDQRLNLLGASINRFE